jgi:uncharacterized tellurite resistance protein B-like protein
MSILEWLGLNKRPSASPTPQQPDAEQTEIVRKIVSQLDDLEPDRARFVAAFAYILGRAAHADLDISDEETRAMENIVTEFGALPEEQAVIVVQMAKIHNELFGHTEDFLVTREFAQHTTFDEKLALLDCLFAVSASDNSISAVENSEIRSIADELRLTQRDFTQARSKYRKHLAVLQQENPEDDAAQRS